jgi:hypothetical protein
MRKILVLLIACFAISIFNTGCVDRNTPNDDPPPPPPPSSQYTTYWDNHGYVTVSPQKYVGKINGVELIYDANNTAHVPADATGDYYGAYKMTFADGHVLYSVFPATEFRGYYVASSDNDCRHQLNAPYGFVRSDWTPDSDNEIENHFSLKDVSHYYFVLGDGSKAGTFDMIYLDGRITPQPVLDTGTIGVFYRKSSAGEHYLVFGFSIGEQGDRGEYEFHITKWDDGTLTYSFYPFEDAQYSTETSSAYTVDGKEFDWQVGDAPSGHKESDYEYEYGGTQYVYKGSGSSQRSNLPVRSSGSSATQNDDDEDTDNRPAGYL